MSDSVNVQSELLAAIRAVPLPVNLDVAGVEGKQFDDSHTFVMALPAWVLREFKKYTQEEGQK